MLYKPWQVIYSGQYFLNSIAMIFFAIHEVEWIFGNMDIEVYTQE